MNFMNMTIDQLEIFLMIIFYGCLAVIFVDIFRNSRKSRFLKNKIDHEPAGSAGAPGEEVMASEALEKFEPMGVLDADDEISQISEEKQSLQQDSPVPLHFQKWYREIGKKRIGHILVEQGIITNEILELALEHQRVFGSSITQYLLHHDYINEKQLAQCLCSQYKVPYLPLESYQIRDEIIQLIPTDIVKQHWVLPIEKHGDILTVVMVDPLDHAVIEKLQDMTGLTIVPFVGIISEVAAALQVYYKLMIQEKKVKAPLFYINIQDYSGVERRNSIRYPARIDIQFPVEGQYVKSQTIDVSRNGFSFESKWLIPKDTFVTLEIHLPEQIDPMPIAAVTKVARCRKTDSDCFEVGVRILRISKQEMGAIMKYAIQGGKK